MALEDGAGTWLAALQTRPPPSRDFQSMNHRGHDLQSAITLPLAQHPLGLVADSSLLVNSAMGAATRLLQQAVRLRPQACIPKGQDSLMLVQAQLHRLPRINLPRPTQFLCIPTE